ncbi:MAG: pyridoxal-phosphate dependent enzyme [Actinocrinis sp.]
MDAISDSPGANSFIGSPPIGPADVKAAAARIGALVRPVTLVAADPGPADRTSLYLAYEGAQVTGSVNARGAAHFVLYHAEHSALPAAGVVLAALGNGDAAVAGAWAARETGTAATVFMSEDCDCGLPDLLRRYGAEVRPVRGDFAAAERAAAHDAEQTGALLSHAYDNPLVALGLGTLVAQVNDEVGADIDTVLIPVGAGALLAGAYAALEHTGIKVVPVEPAARPTLTAALRAGVPVEVPGGTLAEDSLGARRVSQLALDLARAAGCRPVQVAEEHIAAARRGLWERRRLAATYGASVALAAIESAAYKPDVFERVVVVVGGANTDPATLGA